MTVTGPDFAEARTRLAQDACALVDAAAPGRALVFGSLPPDGKDLDLLVREPDEHACREALLAAGFVVRGRRFARFACFAGYEVELEPADGLGVSPGELVALFDEAIPLPPFTHICVPAPHHRLLLLAYVVLSAPGRLDERRRARAREALAEDPRALQRARECAAHWGDPRKLEQLLAAIDGGSPAPTVAAWRGRLRPARRRGLVIALSGIDGSGKSLQARSLQAILAQLGHDPVVEWVPLATNPALDWVGGPLKRVLGALDAFKPPQATGEEGRGIVPNPGRILRQRSPAANQGWSAIVALINGLSHVRRAVPHIVAGRIVIFDRYVLDSVVRLRFFYGKQHRFALQRTLIGALSPRPRAAFFIDVDAATSIVRKDDRWHSEELAEQVNLYREEHARYFVRRLDVERPSDELCAEIAEAVWRLLP